MHNFAEIAAQICKNMSGLKSTERIWKVNARAIKRQIACIKSNQVKNNIIVSYSL